MATDEARAIEAKVVVLGSQGVGKTSLVLRFVKGTFTSGLTSTIGASFMTRKMVVDDWSIRLQIWDTAGQERFRSMAPMYYRGAHVGLVVYDVTCSSSFDDLKSWVSDLSQNANKNLLICLVGSKTDMKRTVPKEKAEAYANELNAIHFETSAKSDEGIQELFQTIARKLIERGDMSDQAAQSYPNSPTRVLQASSTSPGKPGAPAQPQTEDSCCS